MTPRLLAGLLLICAAVGAAAQTFPDKRITLYVSFGPGGPTDFAYRALAEAASRQLGQRIIVENKPGASATLGARALCV